VLDADIAEPVMAKLEADRAEQLRLSKLADRGKLVTGPWGIEKQYVKRAKQMRADLRGGNADAASAALLTLYGPKIPLRPNAERTHLIAETCLDSEVVLEASGGRRTGIFKRSGGLLR
jgi:hypothetical protein